jgi:integrase
MGRRHRNPVEIIAVSQEFKDERARLIFRTAVLTGLRRHELQNLLWRDLDFVDGTLRVRESKSEHGRRTVALPPALREDLLTFRMRGTPFQGDDERVFAHPRTVNKFDSNSYSKQFKAA